MARFQSVSPTRNDPEKRPATITDVAALAGVGIGTVSRVLNDSSQVRAATRMRVREAIEQLGYTPLRAGRGRSERNGFVGVLIPFFDAPSSYQRIRGIVHSLQPYGLELVLYNVDAPDRARNRLAELPRHDLDGLIVVSLPLLDGEGGRLADARFPTVLVDTFHPALPSVVIDDVHGGRLATEHLIALGHERIGFVGEPARNPFGFVSSARREEGFRAAMVAAGLRPNPTHMRYGPHARSSAKQLASELLKLADRPSAIVAASDVQALGVLEAAANLGLSVPGDLAVTGYDDIDLAPFSGLTTVRQPLERSGERGGEVLANAISSGDRPHPFVEELPLEMVVRATTGAPRGSNSAQNSKGKTR
jgi:DNA-binding LacI/PurR family transcriptional regulator